VELDLHLVVSGLNAPDRQARRGEHIVEGILAYLNSPE
jgi:hypothetical protein